MNGLHSALQKFISSVTHLNEDNIYDESLMEEFKKKREDDTLDYPAISFAEAPLYNQVEDQTDVDLENEVRTGVLILLSIFSKSIDDIILFEELMLNQLSVGTELNDFSNDRKIKNTFLSINKNTKPTRESMENSVFRTTFCFNCDGFILPKEIVHPTRFELDVQTQKRVLQHLAILESIYHRLLYLYNICEDSENKEELGKQVTQLEKQMSEMFVFKDMCSDNFSYKNHSFDRCYSSILNVKEYKASTIKDIFEQDSERVKKEEEKKRKIEEQKRKVEEEQEKKKREAEEKARKKILHFSKEGDIQINRYTDAIIQDLKNNISLGNIPIYGGKTYNKWFIHYEEKNISYPNVLITDSSRYHLDLKAYENETTDGNKIIHEYDTNSFPIQYGIIVSIYSNSQEENKKIESAIADYYSQKRTVKVPDYKKQNEFTVITVHHVANNSDKREQIENLYKTQLSFYVCNTVYYLSEYKPEECENNPKLQFRLLQQAQFSLLKSNNYSEALKSLNSLYKPFLEKRRQFFGIFNTQSYKMLLKQYMNGMPITKELFDAGMEPIVKYYPNLFQQFSMGWSYVQIENNIKSLIDFYNKRFNILLGLLKIPQSITKYNFKIDCHSQDAILAYINKMIDPYCELNDAVEEYAEKTGAEKEQERIDRIERERQLEEERAWQEEQGYYDDYSSGRSNGGGILRTAAGVALGNRSLKKEVRKQNEILREQERNREKRAREERSRQAAKSRSEYYRTIEINRERRRKGLPELPLPPVDWY